VFIINIIKSEYFLIKFLELFLLDILFLFCGENIIDPVNLVDSGNVVNIRLMVDDLLELISIMLVKSKEEVPGTNDLELDRLVGNIQRLQGHFQETIVDQLFS